MSFNFMAAVTICSDFGPPPQIKSLNVSIVSPSIRHEVMSPDHLNVVLSQLIHSPLSLSSRGSFIPLYFLSLEWCHLHI